MNDNILRYFQGELSTNERAELLKLIENDDVLKQEFIRFQNLHAITHLSSHSINRDEGQQHFHSFSQQIYAQRTV